MLNFSIDTLNPPVEIPLLGGGGLNIWDKRNYVLTYNPANPKRIFTLEQQLGFSNAQGNFISKKIEKRVILDSDAYALLNLDNVLNTATNKDKVALIQKAFDDNVASKKVSDPTPEPIKV